MNSQTPSLGRLVLALVASLCAGSVSAQVVRLPAVLPSEESPAGRLVSHPDSSAELLQAPGEADLPAQFERPPDARPGVFQKLIFDAAWLAPGGGDGFGMTDLELKAVLAFPFPSRGSPLIVTPGFAVHYLDGPAGGDLPPRVYDAYAQFRWMHRVSPRLGIDLAVTPGVFSDFEQSTDEAIRIAGHGVAMLNWTPRLKAVLGAAYLDREDIDVLPIGGLIWTPHDDLKLELVFPRPRIARRIYWSGVYSDDTEDWIFIAGELGGDAWAIARANGDNDVFNYRDFRITLGVEHKSIRGLDGRIEAGYVFGRKIQYASATPDIEPTSTVMLRAGVTY